MKSVARHTLLLIILISDIGFSFAQGSNASPPAAPLTPQRKAVLPQTLTSAECGFTIGLPGTQSPERHSFKNKDGLQLNSYSFSWITDVGMYNLRCTETATAVGDPVISKSALNRLRDLLVSKNTGKLTRDADLTVEGFPGKEIFLEDAGGIYIQRFYLIGQRAFDLGVYLPNGLRSRQSEAIKILDSFKPMSPSQGVLGEVDKLLESWKGKEKVYGVCLASPQCQPLPGFLSAGVHTIQASSLPQPAYPPIARAARVLGTVEVKLIIDEEGNVIAAQALSGHPLLQSAAVNSARQARFSPTLLNGKPVKIIGVIKYNFVDKK